MRYIRLFFKWTVGLATFVIFTLLHWVIAVIVGFFAFFFAKEWKEIFILIFTFPNEIWNEVWKEWCK